MKPDKAKQPVLLNKLAAAIQRKRECVMVLNGINGPSGEPALQMASGNFLDALKKVSVPLIWTWSVRDKAHFFRFIVH